MHPFAPQRNGYSGVDRDRHAWTHFKGLFPSNRRLYLGWIQAAKTEETRRRRLDEAIQRLLRNLPLGMK